MTDWLILFSNFIAGSVRIIVCLFLISRLLSAKKPEKKSIAMVLAGVAFISIILNVIGLSDFYRTILETILIVVCARCFQETDTRMGLFLGFFMRLLLHFGNFFLRRGSVSYSVLRSFLTMKRGMGKLRSGVSICC